MGEVHALPGNRVTTLLGIAGMGSCAVEYRRSSRTVGPCVENTPAAEQVVLPAIGVLVR